MKTIRKEVFETNSSSSHSITIYVDNPIPLQLRQEVLEIECGEFGWEHEIYNDFTSKAEYAATFAKNYGSPEYENMLKEVILEFTDAKEVKIIKSDDYYEWGFIDHQSIDEAANIFISKKHLIGFLFDRFSSVETDNDNC